MTENNNQFENQITKEKPKKQTLKTLDKPNRQLPLLIQDLLDKNFIVGLSSNGYYVEGFYGIKQQDGLPGFIFAQETTENGTLLFVDSKGHKHYIKNFQELASLNSIVWGQFYKSSEEYKKPNAKWFGFMLELGVLNITPGK